MQIDLDALVTAALDELRSETSDSPVPFLVELHRRGTRDVFERAIALSKSSHVVERALGVRILRELGGEPPRFAREAMPFLLAMLANEKSPDVLRWVVSAVGYQRMKDAAVLHAVLRHTNHEDERVRFSVAAALPGLVDVDRPEAVAIAALVQLSSDANANTRYYAFSGLTDDLHLAQEDSVARALERSANDPDDQIRRAAKRVLEGRSWGES